MLRRKKRGCNASVGQACRPGTCQKCDGTWGVRQSGSQCGTGQKCQRQLMMTQDPKQIWAPSCHNYQSAAGAPSRIPLHFLRYKLYLCRYDSRIWTNTYVENITPRYRHGNGPHYL
eukprot:10433433-Ditylum_brightwellii.AAC.1